MQAQGSSPTFVHSRRAALTHRRGEPVFTDCALACPSGLVLWLGSSATYSADGHARPWRLAGARPVPRHSAGCRPQQERRAAQKRRLPSRGSRSAHLSYSMLPFRPTRQRGVSLARWPFSSTSSDPGYFAGRVRGGVNNPRRVGAGASSIGKWSESSRSGGPRHQFSAGRHELRARGVGSVA